jgi:2-hydroxy-3-oxopropionate reductase
MQRANTNASPSFSMQASTEAEPIGLIGLGLVGKSIARRLLQAGHKVLGFDLSKEACRAAEGFGVGIGVDAREVGARSGVMLLSLFDSASRRSLLFGEQNLLGALRPGTTLIDTSTGRPSDLTEDHERLAPGGIRLIDAALSGSSKVIADGQAIALVGDRSADAGTYGHMLSAFSKAQYFLGAPGRGLEAKLVVNLVFGLNRLALAEALGLARQANLDLGLMLEILRSGETYSRVMEVKGPMMLRAAYEPPVARLGQHFKDVELIRHWAQDLGARVPVTDTHAHLLQELIDAGFGDLDNAAIFKAYDLRKGRP